MPDFATGPEPTLAMVATDLPRRSRPKSVEVGLKHEGSSIGLFWILLPAWALSAGVMFAVSNGLAPMWLAPGLALLIGIAIFMGSGGPAMDALGIWGLALALFVGVAGLVLLRNPQISSTSWLLLAVGVALLAHLLATTVAHVLQLAWPSVGHDGSQGPGATLVSGRVLLVTGASALVLGSAYSLLGTLLGTIETVTPTLKVVGVTLLTLGSASVRSRWSLLLPTGAWLWLLATWGGGGRLTILSLFLVTVLIYEYRRGYHSRVLKAGIIVALVPGLVIAGLVEKNRSDGGGSLLEVPDGFTVGDGLSSLASPLDTLALILQRSLDGELALNWFHTLWATLVLPIPRQLWPGKPEGWGRELAYVFNPAAAYSADHSAAALLPAEFIWGFGVIGLGLGLPLVGLGLAWLNRGLARASRTNVPVGYGAPVLISWSLLSGELLSLWWTGTFTFAARTVLPLLVLMLLLPIMKALSGKTAQADRPLATLES